MEKWRQEFERVEEDGDEQGFEELWNKQQCLHFLNKSSAQEFSAVHGETSQHCNFDSSVHINQHNFFWTGTEFDNTLSTIPTACGITPIKFLSVYSSTQDRQSKLFHTS